MRSIKGITAYSILMFALFLLSPFLFKFLVLRHTFNLYLFMFYTLTTFIGFGFYFSAINPLNRRPELQNPPRPTSTLGNWMIKKFPNFIYSEKKPYPTWLIKHLSLDLQHPVYFFYSLSLILFLLFIILSLL